MEIEELREKLKIDKNQLDQEMIYQPEYYYKVAYDYANAVSERDAAQETLKQVDAELYLTYRQEADDEGRKVTENILDSQIKNSAVHEEAYDVWLEAKKTADELQALKDSYEQRARMLSRLTDLYTTQYYQMSN